MATKHETEHETKAAAAGAEKAAAQSAEHPAPVADRGARAPGEKPEQQAATPQFPVKTETWHAAGFVLSEANGQRSRENAQFNDPATVLVGQPVALVTPATPTTHAIYAVAATGAATTGLSLYSGTSSPGNNLLLSVLARDAEVNGTLINWGSLGTTDQAAAITALANVGIVVRGTMG
jgi:hypothetical protein